MHLNRRYKQKSFVKPLPPELLLHIFSYLSIIDEITHVEEFLDPFQQHYTPLQLGESFATKCAVALVNREFHLLSRSLMLELLSFRKPSHLHAFVRRMRMSAELEGIVQRWTKRLELVFAESPNLSGLDPLEFRSATAVQLDAQSVKQVRRAQADINTALKTCRNLKQFVCCMPIEVDGLVWMTFKDGDVLSKSSLQQFSWNYAPLISLGPCLAPLKALRTLDLSITAMAHIDDNTELPDMPYLHTIRGPLNVICPAFENTNLPSLRTLITCRYRAKTARAINFFRKHGANLKCLALDHTCDVPDLPPLYACPNLEDLVVDWGHLDSMRCPLPNLVRLGLTFNSEKQLPPVLFILYNLHSFDNLLDNFSRLRTIQVVESRVSKHLIRNGPNALRLRQRCLRGRGIELRDEAGEVLIN